MTFTGMIMIIQVSSPPSQADSEEVFSSAVGDIHPLSVGTLHRHGATGPAGPLGQARIKFLSRASASFKASRAAAGPARESRSPMPLPLAGARARRQTAIIIMQCRGRGSLPPVSEPLSGGGHCQCHVQGWHGSHGRTGTDAVSGHY